MGKGDDWCLMNYVQKELRTGKRNITIPSELLEGVSKETITEVKALVKICGVKIVSFDAY